MDIECSKCGVSKAREAFRKGRRQCKECERADYKLWVSLNPERRKAINDRYEEAHPDRAEKYRAENPEYQKRYYEANRESELARGKRHRDANPERESERHKQWRAAKPEFAKQVGRNYHAKNPHKSAENMRRRRARARKSEGSFTRAEWLALVAHFDGRCVCCGKHFGLDGKGLEADHVVPIGPKGSGTISNTQPLCKPCNISKGNRHSTDYRKNPFKGIGQQRLFG